MIQTAEPPPDRPLPAPLTPTDPEPPPSSPSEGPAPLPAHTPIPTAAILDHTLSAQALQALTRLYAAAAGNGYRHTDPLEFEAELAPLLHLSRTQAHNTLGLLRHARLIRWTSDGSNRYTIHLLSPDIRISGNPDSDVDVLIDSIDSSERIQQHTTESGNPDSADSLTVMACLLRAGVWTDHALRIDAQITQNVRRGHANLPDLRDVLGWIAFSFAYRQKNKIAKPAAVLSACLSANRRCPDPHRPPYICTLCRRDEAHCTCPEPDLRLPPKFLDFAFDDEFDARIQTFWGVCRRCHAHPCQCPEEILAESSQEDDDLPTGDTRGW